MNISQENESVSLGGIGDAAAGATGAADATVKPKQTTLVWGSGGAKMLIILMGATYALGTFNDNFFKQAASLLALKDGFESIQGVALVVFSLPFVLFSAWAGWLADRFPKTRIVLAAKSLELLAMVLGAYGIITLNWNFILAMLGVMGLQACILSPALNGAIPEFFPARSVPKVNGIFKMVTTLTILAGIALGGFCLDRDFGQSLMPTWLDATFGQVFVAAIAVFISIVGVLSASLLTKSKSAQALIPFPWTGPLDSALDTKELRREPNLGLALFAEAWFYMTSSLLVLLINTLGERQLGYSHTATGVMSVSLMLGLCIGAVLAGKTSPLAWQRGLLPSTLGMGISVFLAGLVTLLPSFAQFYWLLFVFVITGIAGGFYLIPLTSFIQVRPSEKEKGRVLGISGFLSFSGIILSGGFYIGLVHVTTPARALILCGVASILAALVWGMGVRKIQAGPHKIPPSMKDTPEKISLVTSIFTRK